MNPKYNHIGNPVDRVIEEAAEVIKAIRKCKRFGFSALPPGRIGSNYELMQDEIQDLQQALSNMEQYLNNGGFEREEKIRERENESQNQNYGG